LEIEWLASERCDPAQGAGSMGRECPVSGKKTSFGNQKTDRGKAKYLGGVGKKTTGVSRRTFKPNLQWIHIWLPNGKTRYVRVATSVIRNGKLTLEVDGKMQTFPLIKAAKGSAKARERLKNLYPI
jgi:large subunit ribosomal protein L28